MATYTLRQLKYFVTTVECGSVAEASRKLYIAQPSISTAIKGLEDSFGLQLFIRHHAQGVSLTPGGARFYKKAQELLRMAREFEQNALADNDVIAGQIDIGCFETVAPLYLTRLIAGFNALYPGVEIRIRDGEQQELVQGLTAGRFDLAILYAHDLDATIDSEPLMAPQKPYALLPEGHRFTGRVGCLLRLTRRTLGGDGLAVRLRGLAVHLGDTAFSDAHALLRLLQRFAQRGHLVVHLTDFGAHELLGGARRCDRQRERKQPNDEYRFPHGPS